jgi:hypothetical protein
MVGDHYRDKWFPMPQVPDSNFKFFIDPEAPTRAEFDALKREVEEMKTLLIRAKKYDEDNGEPDCEMSEKVEILKKVAELVGVELPI